jgi:hypothetical protein
LLLSCWEEIDERPLLALVGPGRVSVGGDGLMDDDLAHVRSMMCAIRRLLSSVGDRGQSGGHGEEQQTGHVFDPGLDAWAPQPSAEPVDTCPPRTRRSAWFTSPTRCISSPAPAQAVTDYRDATWIGACERCQDELINICRLSGFTPNIGFVSDDMVVAQALVAAGMGVATLPGLALQAHRSPGVRATAIPNVRRLIHAVTYGDPPDPPASGALIQATRRAVTDVSIP